MERPPQSRDCAGRVPLTLGHFILRNFQADALFWVLVFNVCLGVWQNKHFYRARKLASGKGSPGAAADGPMLSLGLAFLWDCEGELVFRGGGRGVSLGTAEPGAAPRGPAICAQTRPCRERPPSDCRTRPCLHLSSTGAKNHKGKEENLYIYNIKSLGD